MKTITLFIATGLFCAVAGHVSAAERQPVLTARAEVAASSMQRPAALHAKGPGERGAAMAAAKGPEALRRYIGRTQTIYSLRYQDFSSL